MKFLGTKFNNDCFNLGYSHEQGICGDNSKWMITLKDDRKLSTISMPGTHDTMSLGCGGDIAQNQSKPLDQQLISGIRFLDIRLAAFPNSTDLLYLYHGIVDLGTTFEFVLNTVTDFLRNNPSETIFMRIRQEYTQQTDDVFTLLLEIFLNNPKYSIYQYTFPLYVNPELRELRGKFIVVQSYGRTFKWLPYNYFYIQDNFHLRTNWDLYSKWEKVKAQLIKANEIHKAGGIVPFMNYLSGSGGVFPYFVASGHSSPGTYAPRLATGLTEPAFHNYYPDFPRVNWFGPFATIAFEGTNILTRNYINNNNLDYVGIIMADFPGQGLINSVIDVNIR